MLARVLCCFSHVQLFAALWTIAHRFLCPWDSPGKNYWSVLSCPPPEDLPHPGIEPTSPALQADSSLLSHWGSPEEASESKFVISHCFWLFQFYLSFFIQILVVVQSLSYVRLFVTPWIVACQASLSFTTNIQDECCLCSYRCQGIVFTFGMCTDQYALFPTQMLMATTPSSQEYPSRIFLC